MARLRDQCKARRVFRRQRDWIAYKETLFTTATLDCISKYNYYHYINYRPISLLCVSSKVLERIVYNQIIEFVTNNISVNQFGFLHNYSTLQQLLIFTNIVKDSLNTNSQTDVLYLDFKKAFDSVAYNKLFFKLWSFGIIGNLWKWLQAYLTNRVQQVSVNNAVSDVLPVVSGVPQGSILGPILFLVFVNDIPAAMTSSLVLLLFADDAKCVKSISQMSDCLSFQ